MAVFLRLHAQACKQGITFRMEDTRRYDTLAGKIRTLGFAMVPECVSTSLIRTVTASIEAVRKRNSVNAAVSNSSGVFAIRNLTDVVPEVAKLVKSPEISDVVTCVLGPGAFMVRATLFDKTDGANWDVFWHQDLSIAVRQRCDVNAFRAWTVKAGVQCVQPPVELMSRMLAVRLHLDDCTRENGALQVLPGTHLANRIDQWQIDHLSSEVTEVVCEVPAGGLVLMVPLLLHASSPMIRPGHRRVIHLEFAVEELPTPLEWRYRIPCQPQNSLQVDL